jgi:hypothetical protein
MHVCVCARRAARLMASKALARGETQTTPPSDVFVTLVQVWLFVRVGAVSHESTDTPMCVCLCVCASCSKRP